VDIVRDLLDKPVVDRNGRAMGRVDAILLESRDGEPPRVAAILIGPAALASRLRPSLGHWWTRLEQRIGLPPGRPARIDVSEIDQMGPRITMRLTVGETMVEAVEQRLRAWILKIPGSR
jgi:sporulation protein YlmC with PRC-barrel domain